MVRAIITLPEKDKEWLERYSHRHQQSFAETVRLAVQQFRASQTRNQYQTTLHETSGMWKSKKKHALKYVDEIRKEWDR